MKIYLVGVGGEGRRRDGSGNSSERGSVMEEERKLRTSIDDRFTLDIRGELQQTVYTEVPSTDPPMSGHLLCQDTFSMYGLFYYGNVPLMGGLLMNADSGHDILAMCPC